MNRLILPDQVHIEQIRKRLWQDREYGQAAVMIGSGFSRNAEKVSSEVPYFPLWGDLARKMFDELYPNGSFPNRDENEIRTQMTSGNAALKLAEEYESAFGRTLLDNLLIQSIPDNSYIPGHVHKLLLSLPWSDIYTTNYDTLLERTRPFIIDKKYELIESASDIPVKMKPRIVKLHGSLPSHRPFIFTEEDYRKYPSKSAPFVNMVQQSIMENIFCLIGFSGDDPNFLHWTGWVRDNLGESAPCIYLCGLLDLTPSQRKVLERRKVIPIDLSPLFPKEDWPDGQIRHSRAVEWFLASLMKGMPPNKIRWPNLSTDLKIEYSEGLPNLLASESDNLTPYKFQPAKHNQTNPEELKELYGNWKTQRLTYPGWEVCPKQNRDSIWFSTEYWVFPILNAVGNLEPPNDLLLLYELNWRLEVTRSPLFINWAEQISSILENYNPFPQLIKIEKAEIRPDIENFRNLNWNEIGNCWIEVAFSLAKEARDDQDETMFRLWMDRLQKVIKQKMEWQVKWFYEECLYHLNKLDQGKVRQTLENWPETSDLPFWEVKRASIMAELGDLKEAKRIAEAALDKIRSNQQAHNADYKLLSQEGWTMRFLGNLGWNERVEQDKNRWDKLEIYRCSPHSEMDTMKLVVNGPKPKINPPHEERREFDPGHTTTTSHFSSGIVEAPFFPAFAFLRLFEDGAVPLRAGSFGVYSNEIVNAADWIAPFAPLWAVSSIIRTGQNEAIKKWFSRPYVAILKTDQVNHLKDLFLTSLIQSIKDLRGNLNQIDLIDPGFSQRQVLLLSELVSRLCIRFTEEQLDNLLSLTIEMYNTSIFREIFQLHDCVVTLLRRTLHSSPDSLILKRMTDLLSIPIPTHNGFEVNELQSWREPFHYIEFTRDNGIIDSFDRSSWSTPIEKLLEISKSGSPEARKRALIRLVKFLDFNLLTDGEEEKLGEFIWSRLDNETKLPRETGMLNSAFLLLPHPENIDVQERVKGFLLSSEFPRIFRPVRSPDGQMGTSIGMGFKDQDYIDEWLNATRPVAMRDKFQDKIDWTSEEILQLLQKAASWWDAEKNALKSEDKDHFLGSFYQEAKRHFQRLVRILEEVVLPRLGEDEDSQTLARRILKEMAEFGLNTLSTLPMVLYSDKSQLEKITSKLHISMNSLGEEEASASIRAIYLWIAHTKSGTLIEPPEDLISELFYCVVARREPVFKFAINCLTHLLEQFSDLFSDRQIQSLYITVENLRKETELTHTDIADDTQQTRFFVYDKLEYRALTAELAYQLYMHNLRKNKPIPDELEKWKEICKNDPLPEVRKAWPQQD